VVAALTAASGLWVLVDMPAARSGHGAVILLGKAESRRS
jgi:hypothetical protein